MDLPQASIASQEEVIIENNELMGRGVGFINAHVCWLKINNVQRSRLELNTGKVNDERSG